MKRGFVLAVLLLLSAAPFAAGQPPAEPLRVGGPIPPPRKIKDVKPVYPREAQAARATGVVILDVTLGEDGTVRDVALRRSIPLLDQAALDCVRQWQYTPTIVDGKAVPVVMTVTVNFTIDAAPPLPVPYAAPPAMPVSPMSPMSPGTVRLLTWGSQVWDIPVARAAALPRWNIEAAEPPLTLAAATQKARAWVAQANPQIGFEMNGVTLQRIRRAPDVDFWCYQFSYNMTTRQPSMPMLKAVVLPDGSIVEPTPAAAAPAAAVPPASGGAAFAQPAPAGVYRPGNGVTPPRLVRDVKAAYTPEAIRAKITGTVMVECVVGIDGATRSCRIIRSLDDQFGLDQEALKAAAQWRFDPGTRDGQPVPVMVTIEISFNLAK